MASFATLSALSMSGGCGRETGILQHFLAQCAVQFPHTTDYVARVIAWRHRIRPDDVDAGLWNEVARLTVNQNASLGRDSESIWSLWLLKELGTKVSKSTSDLVLSNSGPLVLAWLAHMHARKMATDSRLWTKLRDAVADNPLAGDMWPLSLELAHLGKGDAAWIDTKLPIAVRILHERRASLIEWEARPRVFDEPEDEDDVPDFAIEDYGADYGSDASDCEEDEDEKPGAWSSLAIFENLVKPSKQARSRDDR